MARVSWGDWIGVATFLVGGIGYGSFDFGFATMTRFTSPRQFNGYAVTILLVLGRRDAHSRIAHALAG